MLVCDSTRFDLFIVWCVVNEMNDDEISKNQKLKVYMEQPGDAEGEANMGKEVEISFDQIEEIFAESSIDLSEIEAEGEVMFPLFYCNLEITRRKGS